MSIDCLKHLTASMKERNILPSNIEVTNLGGLRIVNAYNTVASQIISDSITTGTDSDVTIATTKALTEFIERLAFIEGHENKVRECQTERSDGFAAFPLLLPDARSMARINALNEAIERFVWAQWWDNKEIGFLVEPYSATLGVPTDILIKKADGTLGIDKIIVIKPLFDDSSKEVIIFFAFIKNGGVISGGACGEAGSSNVTAMRAASELFRHARAVKKITHDKYIPESFYEKRLAYFLTEDGIALVNARLESKGSQAIQLPELIFDNNIKHANDDLVCVHRCLFKNQPPFVGGALERLCL